MDKRNKGRDPVTRVMEAMGTLTKLSSPRFAHYPGRIALMQQVFGATGASTQLPDVDDKVEYSGVLKMPSYRIGVHFGAVNGMLLNVSANYNKYDLLGPAVSLVFRIQAAGAPHSITVTSVVKEFLDKSSEPMLNFDFCAPSKTLIRGQNAQTTYLLKTFTTPFPHQLVSDLGIRLARRRIVYGAARDGEIGDGAESMYSTATYEQE